MENIERLRSIIATDLLNGTPLAEALTSVADALEEQLRGIEALTERIERLEESAPLRVGVEGSE